MEIGVHDFQYELYICTYVWVWVSPFFFSFVRSFFIHYKRLICSFTLFLENIINVHNEQTRIIFIYIVFNLSTIWNITCTHIGLGNFEYLYGQRATYFICVCSRSSFFFSTVYFFIFFHFSIFFFFRCWSLWIGLLCARSLCAGTIIRCCIAWIVSCVWFFPQSLAFVSNVH